MKDLSSNCRTDRGQFENISSKVNVEICVP